MASLLPRGALLSIPWKSSLFSRPLHHLRSRAAPARATRAGATASTKRSIICSAPALLAAAVVFSSAAAIAPSTDDTMNDVPQALSGDDKKRAKIQRPKSRQAERCVSKCVSTCILGGAGSPGEGPFNVRRPLVVFKDGFRSRQYCLVECSDICNLIKDGEDGP